MAGHFDVVGVGVSVHATLQIIYDNMTNNDAVGLVRNWRWHTRE